MIDTVRKRSRERSAREENGPHAKSPIVNENGSCARGSVHYDAKVHTEGKGPRAASRCPRMIESKRAKENDLLVEQKRS